MAQSGRALKHIPSRVASKLFPTFVSDRCSPGSWSEGRAFEGEGVHLLTPAMDTTLSTTFTARVT